MIKDKIGLLQLRNGKSLSYDGIELRTSALGRPSDVAIGKDDMIYVADSQSDEKTNPGFKQGIRVGSIKDGTVAAFIPATSPETGSPEGVGVDDAGNVYGGWVAKRAVRRFVK